MLCKEETADNYGRPETASNGVKEEKNGRGGGGGKGINEDKPTVMMGLLYGVDSMAAERGGVIGIVTLTVMMDNSSVAKKAQLGFRPWNPPTGSVADDHVLG